MVLHQILKSILSKATLCNCFTYSILNDNLDNKDRSTSGRLQGKNYLPTTATAVYGIQPQYPEPEATMGCNK